MELKNEKEIMSMANDERKIYLEKLHHYVWENGGSLPTKIFPNFICEESKCKCPNCGNKYDFAIINTTNHEWNSWLEHVICMNCGKSYAFRDGV